MSHEFTVFHECQMKECAQYFECGADQMVGTVCQLICASCQDEQKRRGAKR